MTSKRFWALLVGALLLLSTTSALATIYITQDGGGIITDFEQRYETFRASGADIVIDGVCASACTIVTVLPENRVCVTERARLGFHSAAIRMGAFLPPVFSQEGTDMVWKAYPEKLRKLLRERGWDGGELEGWQEGKLIWLDYNDMKSLGYRDCNDPLPWLERIRRWWRDLA